MSSTICLHAQIKGSNCKCDSDTVHILAYSDQVLWLIVVGDE
jgi:hypothetical protein